MRKVAIYFNSIRLDLFGDEEINLVRKATDYRDLGKVFTDFTETFTVPATPTNNKALKHYYDISVTNGWGQSEAVDGWIEVDTLTVRSGTFIIEGAKLRNGIPTSYSLTFYGALKGLKDLFGEDKLSDLDLSAYDHTYNFTNVETGVEGAGLSSGAIYYPLISPVRKWSYNSNSGNHDSFNIAYHSGHSSNEHGIWYYELKPALQVAKIIDAIEAKYGFIITSDFFASAAFTDLYLWLHRTEGYMPQASQKISVSVTPTFLQHTWNNTTKILTADYDCTMSFQATGASGRPLFFDIYLNGVLYVRGYETSLISYPVAVQDGDEIEFRFATQDPTIENSAALTISFTDGVYTTGGGVQLLEFDASQTFYYSYVYMDLIVPDVSVYDFIGYLMKLFNLIVYPSATGFTIEPYSDWLADGTQRNISRYINDGDVSMSKANIYSEISFKHNKPGTAAGKLYEQTFEQAFGDLDLQLDYQDAETFSVESGFEMPVFERLFDDNDNTPTQILTAAIIADNEADPKPYLGGLWLLYYIDKPTGLTKSFNLLTAAGADNEITAYHRFGTANESSLSANTLSICFGAAIDPYFGLTVTRGLYAEYYQNMINDIYNSRTRIIDVEAVLPLPVIIQLEMNDQIVIGSEVYRIEDVTISLNTGRAKFKLINVV